MADFIASPVATLRRSGVLPEPWPSTRDLAKPARGDTGDVQRADEDDGHGADGRVEPANDALVATE